MGYFALNAVLGGIIQAETVVSGETISLLAIIIVFILSVFLGLEVISKVPAALHTPLMSGTNAIHGIVLVGAMIVAGAYDATVATILGFIAVVFAAGNVVGGFVVTDRMLQMFKQKPQPGGSAKYMGGLNVPNIIIEVAYLVAAICFIIGLKRLSSPALARSGNQIAAFGMLVAVVATLFARPVINPWYILIGSVIGGGIGFFLARSVQMTAMPQMVALFNGMGGGAAALTSISEYLKMVEAGGNLAFDFSLATILGVVIGSVSFSGSIIALGKLQGFISSAPITYKGQQVVNGLIFVLIALMGIYMVGFDPQNTLVLWAAAALALVLGVAMVLPIGGADMPVVISLLNSFTGLAAAFTGFVLRSTVLVISGALVGASGTLLTQLMGKAMNRPLTNVLFGAFGSAGDAVAATTDASGRSIREVGLEDAATLLAYANQVVIVPGYGMAVARAQNSVQELAKILEQRGVEVKYAIHPVAGRMPGHMNVLLAEADVPYNQLFEMDEINPEFGRTDVVLVIGANDVVNPAARHDQKSPIYGMPILDVDKAANVIIMKRSMRSGFAGIENELFYEPKTSMLFGDAKETAEGLVSAVKQL